MSQLPPRRTRARTASNGHAPVHRDSLTTVARSAPRAGATEPLRRPRLPLPRLPSVDGLPGMPALRSRATLPSMAVLSGLPTLPSLGRLRQFRSDLPTLAMGATGSLALKLRDLTGRDVLDLESLQELMSVYYRLAALREQHQNRHYEIDDFGFDREWTEALMPLFRVVFRRYWRVEVSGLEHIPRDGRALLVSNHAGVLPWDGAMIKVAVFDAVERHARALAASWFGELPVASWFLRRTGQTPANPDDSLRLLQRDELVLVFPEGVRGTGKPWSERYRLRRFGRGGFVSVAIRGRAPIIPVSVIGSEETYPMLADIRPIARLLGMPYFPITPTWPLLGAAGLLPLPSKWRIQFHPPVRTDEMPVREAANPAVTMDIADAVRTTIQAGVIDNLMLRQRTFRG